MKLNFNYVKFYDLYVIVCVLFLCIIWIIYFGNVDCCTPPQNGDFFFKPGSVVDTPQSSMSSLPEWQQQLIFRCWYREPQVANNTKSSSDFVLYSSGSNISEDLVLRAGEPNLNRISTVANPTPSLNHKDFVTVTDTGISAITTDTTVSVDMVRNHPAVANDPYMLNNVMIEEIIVPTTKKGLFNKIKLSIKYVGMRLDSVYLKYHNKGKRKLYWTLWEQDKGNYSSYKEFKKDWNPNTEVWKSIRKELKKDLRADVEELLRVRDPFSRYLGNRNRNIIEDFLP